MSIPITQGGTGATTEADLPLVRELRARIAELEAALRKIVAGPAGPYDHESGCPFERFACAIARDALSQQAKP